MIIRSYARVLILLLGTSCPVLAASNLLSNPGFEDGTGQPSDWTLGHEGRGAGSAEWVSESPHSGRYSVRLEMKEAGDYWMAQQRTGSVLPERHYRIAGMYRGTSAHPCVYFLDKEGLFLSAWEMALQEAESWTEFSFIFQTPAGTDHFEIQLRAQGGPGSCGFDDVLIEDAEEEMQKSRERAQYRRLHRDEILREALGASGAEPCVRSVDAWQNLSDEGWMTWAEKHGTDPRLSPVASGARNEYVSFQVLYVPQEVPKSICVEVTDLVGPQKRQIHASSCQARMLEYIPFGEEWLPDPLVEDQPFTPPKQGPTVFWITIHIPEEAKAGTYRGVVKIHPDPGEEALQGFEIKVWNAVLPQETHLQSSFWLFRAQIKRTFGVQGDLSMEDYFPYMDLATSHRLSPIDVVEGPTSPMVKVFREKDGALSYDFSQWDQYLDRMKAGGANTIHLGFTHWMAHYFCEDLPDIVDRTTGETVHLGYDFGSSQHLDALSDYLRAAAKHLKERGDFEKCYIQPWDEPNGEGLAKSALILKGIRDRVPEVPRLMDAVYPDALDNQMKDVVNLWCPLSPSVEGDRYREVRERGDKMWWYVCCGPGRPYANFFTNWKVPEMRALFWQTWQYKITGVLYWGLNYWLSWDAPVPAAGERFPSGPWVSSTTNLGSGHIGDGYFIYPGKTIDHPLSSLRLETLRDGIEDYEMLYLLNSLVDQSPDASPETLALASEVLKIRSTVSKNLTEFDREGTAMESERQVIAGLIEELGRKK